MNKYRMNQMLEILLFPVIGSDLGKEDLLLKCYEAYEEFLRKSEDTQVSIQERMDCEKKYKKLRGELVEFLIRRNHGRVKSEDDVRMLCDLYYPMEDLRNAMRYFSGVRTRMQYASIPMENISSYYVRRLAHISSSLITYRDGVAAIRQWVEKEDEVGGGDLFGSSSVYNKIEIWNLLCRVTSPDLYIAIAAVDSNMGMEVLYEQKPNIALADKLLVKSIQRGVAENHLHFNVGFDYEIRWLYHVNLDFVQRRQKGPWDEKDYKRLQMALFRCIAASFFEERCGEEGFGIWARKNFSKELVEIIWKLYKGEHTGSVSEKCQEDVYRMYTSLKAEVNIRGCDYLLDRLYFKYIEYKTSSEFILLYQCYEYLKKEESDTFFSRVFLQFTRLKNEYFHNLCQQQVLLGLNYFQKKYHLTQKSMGEEFLPVEDMMVEVFRSQAKIAHLRKLEIRVAPWVDGTELEHFSYVRSRGSILQQLSEQLCIILNAYRRYILEGVIGVKAAWRLLKEYENQKLDLVGTGIIKEVRQRKIMVPTLGIVFHFLKRDYLEDICGLYCWRSVCKDKDQRTSHRLMRRLYFQNLAVALEELRSSIPKLNEYIVGMDAASDENAEEPWMFAAAYKEMRSHYHTRPVLELKNGGGFDKVQNIGFTYHVGEDFRHVVSGLRHVDEILEHFGYKAGDRLGHALVLGIDIKQWIADNEVVALPIQEHLENLLWMWGMNVCEGNGLPIQMEVLEHRINHLIKVLYEEPETISIKMLYEAYQMKFGKGHKQIAYKHLKPPKEGNHFCCCRKAEECYRGWTAEKLLLTNYCYIYEGEKKYAKVIPVQVSADDVVLYEKLQEYLIDKVEERGIFVETNPTSNLAIGEFPNIHKHPIFSLNERGNPMGNKVLVTVNSDDPAVFNTNVENELAYVYYAAEEKGIAKSDILQWIDLIREYGLEASFIQKEKSAEQILFEIEEILEELRLRRRN